MVSKAALSKFKLSKRLALRRSVQALTGVLLVLAGRAFSIRNQTTPWFATAVGRLEPSKYVCAHLFQRIELGKSIMISKTAARAPFLLVHADPESDTVISAAIRSHGLWDVHVLRAVEQVIGTKCVNRTYTTLDVGSNIGFFTLAMLAMGCRVKAFEMQGDLTSMIETSACVNKFSQRLEVITGAVSDEKRMLRRIDARHGNLGGVGILSSDTSSATSAVEVESRTLDELVGNIYEPILIMKMDLEGHEPQALKGATSLLEKRQIQNIILEVSPEQTGVDGAVEMLRRLWKYGFSTVRELDYADPSQYGGLMQTRPIVLDTDDSARSFVENLVQHGDHRGAHFTDLLLSLT